MILSATNPPTTDALPSAQTTAEGAPRFRIPALPAHPAWPDAVAVEEAGGVEAETRAFLDAQLETGDVVLDLDPGFGFVALSAATAPGALPTVFVGGLASEHLQALQDAAADAGGWLDEIDAERDTDLAALADTRLDTNGRVAVHLSMAQLPDACARIAPLHAAGRMLALCIGDAWASDAEWSEARAVVEGAGYAAFTLAERDGDVVLLPLVGAPEGAVIALPSNAATVDAATADVSAAEASTNELPVSDAPISADESRVELFPAVAGTRWSATRDGICFIAPHARTGYGIVGAALLRAMQARAMPVAYFPIGPVDRSIGENPSLDIALRLQGAFRSDVPSVRLSQQFDLAMHAGRGPRVGFTIFELDAFSERERHHLASQDAIIVPTEWAKRTLVANGIGDRPIHVVPLGVDRTVFHEDVARRRQENETVFLQVGKLEPRKGQLELLRAFESAFTPDDAVRLVLVCGNPFMPRDEFDAALRPFMSSRMAGRISLVTSELPTQRDIAAVMAAADCGVFPVRAEGWNLEALEMLSMGKAVIASACTAHEAYLTAANARLISMDGLEVAHGGAAIGRWASWGAAQHEQLVAALRDTHAAKSAGRLARNDAGIETAKRFTWDASADAMIAALQQITG